MSKHVKAGDVFRNGSGQHWIVTSVDGENVKLAGGGLSIDARKEDPPDLPMPREMSVTMLFTHLVRVPSAPAIPKKPRLTLTDPTTLEHPSELERFAKDLIERGEKRMEIAGDCLAAASDVFLSLETTTTTVYNDLLREQFLQAARVIFEMRSKANGRGK